MRINLVQIGQVFLNSAWSPHVSTSTCASAYSQQLYGDALRFFFNITKPIRDNANLMKACWNSAFLTSVQIQTLMKIRFHIFYISDPRNYLSPMSPSGPFTLITYVYLGAKRHAKIKSSKLSKTVYLRSTNSLINEFSNLGNIKF